MTEADAPQPAAARDDRIGPDPTWEALPPEQRERWLADITDFPPPPLLLELLGQDLRFESYDPQALAEKVTHDPVLVGRLLSRANAAAFGLIKPLTSLRQAMVHLGYNLVRSTIVRYQVEASAERLQGIVRQHILGIQRSTDLGAVISFNWAKALMLDDPAEIATRCLLGRLGTFLLARRFPEKMAEYFAAGHEPQRLNFEANHFDVTSRTLTYKVAQAWKLPDTLQVSLFHLWTPLFAPAPDERDCVACAGFSLGFDPPLHMDDIQKWLSLRVHHRLRENLDSTKALARLPDVLENEAYRREMAALND